MQELRVATVFSGIGALEESLKQLKINHIIKFACDNGEREPKTDLNTLYKVAKKVATALKEVTGCDGINILQNNGEVAGQTVFHLHIHIIPRYEKGEMVQWTPGELDETVVAEIIEKSQDLL